MVSERREYLQEEGIADTLYTKGLTQEQVGEVFNDIYGEHYSKASMSRMRGAMPNEESVILLMGKTAMDKKSYLRQVPRIDLDRTLFPDE